MNLPLKYAWLKTEPAPRMLLEGLKLYGTKEVVGKQHNPVILGWARELKLQNVYTVDEIPWCGLVHAFIAKQAGKPVVKDPLWALNWSKWGDPSPDPMLGDTLTFKRPGGGHVGLYIGEDKTTYHVLGGNQQNAYNITRIEKTRLYAARRLYAIGIPENVRKVFLSASGIVSVNEG
jgi:uncharacterized protein (TIGR02594 family)